MSWHIQQVAQTVFVAREYKDPSPHRAFLLKRPYTAVCAVLDKGGLVEVVGLLARGRPNIRSLGHTLNAKFQMPIYWERASGKRVFRLSKDIHGQDH